MMEAEYINETFRSEPDTFYKNFADYLIIKRTDHWNAKNCTFFRNDDKNRMWAWCLFERRS